MATGKGRQSHLNSLGLKGHTFAALWGLLRPEGPLCFRGVQGLPAEGAVKVRRWLSYHSERATKLKTASDHLWHLTQTVQELLGHKDVKTMMICAYPLNRGEKG